MKSTSNVSSSLRFAAALCALAMAAAPLHAEPGKTPAVGDTFPALAQFGLEGQLPDLGQAKVVVVDFWASWCGPCKASFPVYEELRQQYGERGVVVVAVSVDRDPKAMAAFLARQKPAFSIVRDANQKLVQAVAPPTMPTSFIIDAKGVVRAVHHGFHGEATRREYLAEIDAILKEAS